MFPYVRLYTSSKFTLRIFLFKIEIVIEYSNSYIVIFCFVCMAFEVGKSYREKSGAVSDEKRNQLRSELSDEYAEPSKESDRCKAEARVNLFGCRRAS